MLAQDSHEALTHDSPNARGKKETLDAHVDKPRNCAGRRIGVQRRQNQVACEGGVHSDAGGFSVAHFTYHYHIRILA
jgi:hypothetical protein